MNSGNCAPIKVAEGHTWVVYLMHNVVELVYSTESCKLYLTAPSPILLHVRKVLINRLIILYEWREVILMSCDMIYSILTILSMQLFIAFQLISNGSEQTVAIPTHFDNL